MELTIVGLGMIGTSAGLALKAATGAIPITGHDPEPSRAQRAKALGAIDKSHWNLPAACRNADIILLDLGLGELETTLRALAGEIKEGALLIDTLPIKRPVLELAARVLAPGTPFVGGHIVPHAARAGEWEPSAALLQGATFYLVAGENTGAEALDRATNLATALGAIPRYIDATEHDGLAAATQQLPLLGTIALLDALSGEPGWEDRAGAMGPQCAALASVLLQGAPDPAPLLLANREHALRWLDLYAQRLVSLRQTLESEDRGALDVALARATEAGRRCTLRPEQATPGGEAPSLEPGPEMEVGSWRDMFLGRLGRGRRPPEQGAAKNKSHAGG